MLVLHTSVKEQLESVLFVHNDIKVIHSRDLSNPMFKSKRNNKKIVSFIGAINQYKDISALLDLINTTKFHNIEFHLYSKGILEYCNEEFLLNSVIIKDEYFDSDKYQEYIRESDFLYLSYKENYGIRFSGMVFDALNNGCKLICNNNPSFSFVKDFNAGYIFNDKEDLKLILKKLNKNEIEDDVNMDIFELFSSKSRESLFLELVNELSDKY